MFALTHIAIEWRYLAYKKSSVLMRLDTIRGRNYIENIIQYFQMLGLLNIKNYSHIDANSDC